MPLTFQFHKGAIRTQPDLMKYQQHLDFNSIKVRLEQTAFIYLTAFVTFQFHKGAIRTTINQYNLQTYEKFQFHKGAIRTRRIWH